MLPEDSIQLLTAYVDGELGAKDEEAALTLLRESVEARNLLHQLQQDADALRTLSRVGTPRDLAADVLAKINQTPAPSIRPRSTAPRPATTWPLWTSFAAAAAVLLVVGTSSWLYVASLPTNNPVPLPVAAVAEASLPDVVMTPDTKSDKGTATAKVEERPINGPELMPEPRVLVKAAEPKPAGSGNTEVPGKTSQDEILASPAHNKLELKEAKLPRLALTLGLRDLDQEKHQRLRAELRREASQRVDLPCVDGSLAFPRLQTVCREQGIHLLLDEEARKCLAIPVKGINYLIYTDQVTADELGKLLAQLGQEDKKAETQRRGSGQFNNFTIDAWKPTEQLWLTRSLGEDLMQPARPQPATPAGVDVRKPVSAGTSDQVAQTLKGQGTPRPAGDQPDWNGKDRLALVLVYQPERAPRPANAPLVRFFFSNRKEVGPQPVQLMLILRNQN